MAVHLRRLLPVAVLLVLSPERAAACPICFAGVESPLLDSARVGVFAMATVTVGVLGAFAAWFVRLARLEGAAPLAGRPDSPDLGPPTPDPGSR
ncbi:MAG TPA: hypothetical protein VGD94_09865 [Vicinamibacterales bacterium]